ncbi:MAG: CapA family protein [Muribaculaceae bacterium]|nr:CapA family protein [Muribaculaceae bacterium]
MRVFNIIALAALMALISCNVDGSSGSGAEGNDSTATTKSEDKEKKPIVDTVTLAMNGDIMTGTILPTRNMPPNDGKDIFVDCADILRRADVACGNLEGVLADSGKTRKPPGPLNFSFMMPTKSVKLLVDAGYDFLGIANNHINDFYPVCIESTIKTLRDNNIGVAGTKACETSVKEINGVKYGFCAFGHEEYSLKTQDTATVKRIVKQLRKDCDIVIVCFHGGAEGVSQRHLPNGTEYFYGADRGNLRQFAHLCIDNGADIVYGHGPHVCRAMELYKGHLIAYSLGNFATPRGMSLHGPTAYAPVLVARIDGKGMFIDGKIHSFIQYRDKGPRRDAGNAVVKEIRMLTQEDIKDNQLNIADDGTITKK